MSGSDFIFSPENTRRADSFRNVAVSFINHKSFNLRDGDIVIVYSDYAAIKRHDTGKMGLYRADNGMPILYDVFDTIELRHSEKRMKKYAEHSKEELFFEVSINGSYGAYSVYGLQLVPIKYKKGIILFDNLFIVTSTENGCYGVYDYKGRMVLPEEYKNITIRYGIIVGQKKAKYEDKFYAFNRYGQCLFMDPFYGDKVKGFDKITIYEKCIIAREDGLEELFTKEGSQIIVKKMKSIHIGPNYIIAEDENGKFGVYDYKRNILLAHEFDRITRFGQSYIKARYGKTECLFYKDGHTVIGRGRYQRITETKNGAIAITLNGTKEYFELRMYMAISK